MASILIALVLGFFLFEFVVFLSHRFMHMRWTGPLWKAHQEHHALYNPKRPETAEFHSVGWRSFRFRAIIFLVVVGLLFWIFPLSLAMPLLVEMSVLSALTSYMHDATHTAGHPLERFAWYRKLKREHWTHHANAKKNLGILTFLFDRMVGSFRATGS